jgi:hypothetical protein
MPACFERFRHIRVQTDQQPRLDANPIFPATDQKGIATYLPFTEGYSASVIDGGNIDGALGRPAVAYKVGANSQQHKRVHPQYQRIRLLNIRGTVK